MPFDEETTLRMRWNKREKDWMTDYPNKSDGFLIQYDLIQTDTFQHLIAELQERGYDITTLQFSVKRPKPTKQSDEFF